MGGWDNAPEYGGGGGGKWATVLGVIAAALFSAVIAWLYFAGAAAQATTVAGVASVVDGDTIEIHGQRVRLSGIDAPESGKRCGDVNVYQRASLALSNVVGSRTVSCAVREHDRYGRAVARCNVAGADLGNHMVEQGWARDWPRYSGGQYADEEARARIDRRGIWGMQCPTDLWGRRDYSAGAGSVLPAAAARPPSATAAEIAYVSATALNVRAGPGAEHAVVGRLPRRARVAIQERSAEWARVEADGADGWVSSAHLSATEPAAPVEPVLSDAGVRSMIIERSLASYSGSCPCPYNVDRGGRRCGGRSAYSRPAGASPVCYPSDVSDAQVRAFRRR